MTRGEEEAEQRTAPPELSAASSQSRVSSGRVWVLWRGPGRQPCAVTLSPMGDGGVMHLSQCLHAVGLQPRDTGVTLQCT